LQLDKEITATKAIVFKSDVFISMFLFWFESQR